MDDALEARLHTVATTLADSLRQIGLYANEGRFLSRDDGRVFLAVSVDIGDVAFTTRVQDPEQAQFDDQFRQVATEVVDDDFLETRERMRRRIAEGKNPFGED